MILLKNFASRVFCCTMLVLHLKNLVLLPVLSKFGYMTHINNPLALPLNRFYPILPYKNLVTWKQQHHLIS